MSHTPTREADVLLALTRHAEALLAERPRVVLGISGAPGAGKSTLARELAARVDSAVVVPMDGFHLAQRLIRGTPAAARRGAIDTFDVDGFVSLLRRVRAQTDRAVYAPDFIRGLEDPVAASISIEPSTRLVLVEGNYLLSRKRGWREIASLIDESWYLEVDDDVRRRRLIARHLAHGSRAPEDVESFVAGSDEVNAREIAETKDAADLVVTIVDGVGGELSWSR